MELFDLPQELFHEILVYAVLVRGVRRALRLRLVCSRPLPHLGVLKYLSFNSC